MTQTLREEIKEAIQMGDPDYVYKAVDEILKLIEKRIDSVKMEGYANAGWVSACVRMKEEVSTT